MRRSHQVGRPCLGCGRGGREALPWVWQMLPAPARPCHPRRRPRHPQATASRPSTLAGATCPSSSQSRAQVLLRPLPPRGFTPSAGACTPPSAKRTNYAPSLHVVSPLPPVPVPPLPRHADAFVRFAGAMMMPPPSRPRAQAAHAAWASSVSADGGTVAAGPT